MTGVCLLIMLMMRLFPETPFARRLTEMLVTRPMQWLATISMAHIIFIVVITGMMVAGSELILMAGSMDIALALGWDISLWLDAILMSYAVAAGTGIKAGWQGLRARIGRLAVRPKARQRRKRVRRGPMTARKSHNDDEPGSAPGIRLAA